MPNTLNYATAYQAALAQAYPYVLHFAALRSTENDGRHRWTGAKTIEIPSLSTTGRVDGSRDTIGTASRNFDNAWEPKTLANHRKWSTQIHPMDIDETKHVATIQNITKVFNEEQEFPEMDACLVSKIDADHAAMCSSGFHRAGAAGFFRKSTKFSEANPLGTVQN